MPIPQDLPPKQSWNITTKTPSEQRTHPSQKATNHHIDLQPKQSRTCNKHQIRRKRRDVVIGSRRCKETDLTTPPRTAGNNHRKNWWSE
ncbi:hypothetical protein P8452_59383 [Trifolium repens]|nr:hypothetical protein P8452_59383 [Trifolium repens]